MSALEIAAFVAALLLAYLVGSIPFGVVVGKLFYHVDVREHGSGNVGTTNVFRVLGKKAGVAVLVCDMLKGYIPAFIAAYFLRETDPWLVIFIAAAPVVGHMYSVFLKGRGGKGVATGAGVVIALVPLAVGIIAVVWVLAHPHHALREPRISGRHRCWCRCSCSPSATRCPTSSPRCWSPSSSSGRIAATSGACSTAPRTASSSSGRTIIRQLPEGESRESRSHRRRVGELGQRLRAAAREARPLRAGPHAHRRMKPPSSQPRTRTRTFCPASRCRRRSVSSPWATPTSPPRSSSCTPSRRRPCARSRAGRRPGAPPARCSCRWRRATNWGPSSAPRRSSKRRPAHPRPRSRGRTTPRKSAKTCPRPR